MARTISAVSLIQPYASLIGCGAKRIETRSWPTKHRGLLAIHASKGFPPEYRDFAAGGRVSQLLGCFAHLPLGKVVAVCRVVDCLPVDQIRFSWGLSSRQTWEQEEALGDYSEGRYGWLLEDIRPLPEPVPAKGALSLWQWECTDAVWEQLGLGELQAVRTEAPLGGLFATAEQ